MTHHTIHKQEWYTLTRYIISCEEGTITIEFYKKPIGEYRVRIYICNLWVKEPYRRQSIATQLLHEAEQIARDNGYKCVFLEWDRRDTPRYVREWYRREGYQIWNEGEYKTLMKKMI